MEYTSLCGENRKIQVKNQLYRRAFFDTIGYTVFYCTINYVKSKWAVEKSNFPA